MCMCLDLHLHNKATHLTHLDNYFQFNYHFFKATGDLSNINMLSYQSSILTVEILGPVY